jgi:hypothetical protein
MMLTNDEIRKIKARIAKAQRRIAAGYVPKTKETEEQKVVRLTALLATQDTQNQEAN